MNTMIYLSLLVNIVVLTPIVILMAIRSRFVDVAWGVSTDARGILFAIYLAILIASIVLVVAPIPAFVAALLSVQVIYKVITPFTVGRITNPVVISNLIISILHVFTLVQIFSNYGSQFVAI
jgi:hypothetical protein